MATKSITITITYDDAFEIPADEQVKRSLSNAIGDGLLTFDEEEAVVDDWTIAIKSIA